MSRTALQVDIANRTRQVFRAQWGPEVYTLPVDLTRWTEALAIRVEHRRFNRAPDFHGGVAEQPASGLVMLVNDLDDFRVQRFTIAHEIGHVLLRHHRKSGTQWWFETEANTIASEILLPWPYLEHVIQRTVPQEPGAQTQWWAQTGPRLARQAVVTEAVVAYHFQDLGWPTSSRWGSRARE